MAYRRKSYSSRRSPSRRYSSRRPARRRSMRRPVAQTIRVVVEAPQASPLTMPNGQLAVSRQSRKAQF